MERLKRIYGYLLHFKEATICFVTEEPDLSALPVQHYDWMYTVYGDVKELIPQDILEPLGKHVVMISYVDANLFHDIITGRSVSGILHMLNKTPIEYFSKKQGTVETATYGSEFVAARIATEQIMDLRIMLRYLGMPIREVSYLFSDNKSVVDTASIPHFKLHK